MMSFADFFLIFFFAKVCPAKKLSLKSFGKKNSLPFSIKKGVLTSLSRLIYSRALQCLDIAKLFLQTFI